MIHPIYSLYFLSLQPRGTGTTGTTKGRGKGTVSIAILLKYLRKQNTSYKSIDMLRSDSKMYLHSYWSMY